MASIDKRLGDLEGRTGARASPGEGRPPWRTPEEEAERERQFRRLYMQIGVSRTPEPKSGEAALEELFEAIEIYRESTDRKDQDHE